MKLKELANQLKISLGNLQNFIFDFDIPLFFVIDDSFNITESFKSFCIKHNEFIKKYAEDRNEVKKIQKIAQNLNIDIQLIEDFFIKNGVSKEKLNEVNTQISSYVIHGYIGANYDAIYNDLPQNTQTKGLIGYTDMFFYMNDMLDPFINKDQKCMWGISKPLGIVVYGPPGSGKTFWAEKIAQMIGYEFIHLFKDYHLATHANQNNDFNDFLKSKINQPKTLIYIDNFDKMMNNDGDYIHSPESKELVSSIIKLLQKDNSKELVLVGSAEIISRLDEEIVAPGRFDLHLPIFPPNLIERADLILHNLTKDLSEQSPLLNILSKSNALNVDFWLNFSKEMKLFSNTMIIDFTQSIKKRLYAIYRKDENKEILLTEQIIVSSLNESKIKFNDNYIKLCMIFKEHVKQNNQSEFAQRIMDMEHELFHFIKKEEKINHIGFKTE